MTRPKRFPAPARGGKLSEPWTVLKILQWTAGYFRDRGIERGRLDAELLLAETLGLNRVGLYLNYDRPLDAEELGVYRERVSRRGRREPLAYILGRTEFWSLPISVTPAVLIPRPDTEALVEEALSHGRDAATILDVGTGSGAIALALASELPAAAVTGVDVSPEALAVAAENARRNGLAERIVFRREDLAALSGGPYDLIVSNPPYISVAELEGLMPEVRDYEPRQALDGGADGLDCYRHLARQAATLLRPGGWLLVEIGSGQQDAVRTLWEQAGLADIFERADYAGIPRVVGGRSPG